MPAEIMALVLEKTPACSVVKYCTTNRIACSDQTLQNVIKQKRIHCMLSMLHRVHMRRVSSSRTIVPDAESNNTHILLALANLQNLRMLVSNMLEVNSNSIEHMNHGDLFRSLDGVMQMNLNAYISSLSEHDIYFGVYVYKPEQDKLCFECIVETQERLRLVEHFLDTYRVILYSYTGLTAGDYMTQNAGPFFEIQMVVSKYDFPLNHLLSTCPMLIDAKHEQRPTLFVVPSHLKRNSTPSGLGKYLIQTNPPVCDIRADLTCFATIEKVDDEFWDVVHHVAIVRAKIDTREMFASSMALLQLLLKSIDVESVASDHETDIYTGKLVLFRVETTALQQISRLPSWLHRLSAKQYMIAVPKSSLEDAPTN